MKHLLIFTALFALWTAAAAQSMPAGNENDPGRHWTPDEVCQPSHPQLLPASRHDFYRHDGGNDLAPRRGLRGSDTDRDDLLRRHEQHSDGAQRVAPQTAGEIFNVDGIIYRVNSDDNSVEVTYTLNGSSYNYSDIKGAVSIPQSVYHNGKYYPVTAIGHKAFCNCKGLTSINIPNSVSSIGESAFYYCSGLTSVTIGNSVTAIGHLAFFDCSKLTSINIPNSVTSIGNEAFCKCKGLTSINIPNSVTSIGNEAFTGCSGLTSIKVDAGNAYYDSRNNCNAIIETKSNSLIIGCMNTIIPNSVSSIGSSAFSGCTGLTGSLTIPNSVTSIGWGAFMGCSGLTSINIPNLVSSIGSYAFYYCSALTSVTIGNSVSSIGSYAFAYCSGLTSINIPNSVSSIGKSAFYYCSALTSINIPDSVTSIGDETFRNCKGLTSINIPNSVSSIGWRAFDGCSGLTEIHSLNPQPPTLDNYVFYGVIKSIPLYVPSQSVSMYNRVSGWKDFTNVKNEPVPASFITLNNSEVSLASGTSTTLTATILPDDAIKIVTWKSSNNAIATVDSNGKVTGIAPGTATITATTTDGTNLSATCKVTVTAPEPEFVTGDANGDGFVRINDVVTTSNYILGDEPAGFVFAAADVNQDGFVRINDVVLIANIILDGGNNAPARVAAMHLAGNDYMTAQGVEIKAGETRHIDVELNNDNAFSALQMDINLPDGLVLKGATLTGRADGHNLMTGRTVNGKATIAAFSTESNNFIGNNGAVIRLEVMATGNVTEDIKLDNIYASTAKGVLKQLDAVSVGVNAVTGINDITVGNGLVNVYNTAGQLVRRNANASEATRNLPAGIYIVNNKKVVVK